MRGSGKGSFGRALLRSVKSMHIRMSPLGFGTTTEFASRVGCITSRITLAFSSFRTSLMMKSCQSWAWCRTFFLTRCASGHTARWCSITSLGTTERSEGSHANTSEFSRRKATSALSYLGVRAAPMVKV
jgi:hypothetical protein